MKIFVLHRGWVVCGVMSSPQDGFFHLENAYVIRRWGTASGLGEIARGGPTKSTVLDECPPMDIPVGAVINIIHCNSDAWKAHIS